MKLKITEEQLVQLKEIISLNENAFADSDEEMQNYKIDSNLSLIMLFKNLHETIDATLEIEKLLMGDEKNTERLKKVQKYLNAARAGVDAIIQTRGLDMDFDDLKPTMRPLDWKETPFSKNQ